MHRVRPHVHCTLTPHDDVHCCILQGKPIVGWSEYIEERNIGVTQVIEWMGELVVGLDP